MNNAQTPYAQVLSNLLNEMQAAGNGNVNFQAMANNPMTSTPEFVPYQAGNTNALFLQDPNWRDPQGKLPSEQGYNNPAITQYYNAVANGAPDTRNLLVGTYATPQDMNNAWNTVYNAANSYDRVAQMAGLRPQQPNINPNNSTMW